MLLPFLDPANIHVANASAPKMQKPRRVYSIFYAFSEQP